jgi:ParB family chromosome partitioning protein
MNVQHQNPNSDQYDAGSRVAIIDPKAIRRSLWANRLDDEFKTAAFAQLKAEIAASGGNVQPIKVRTIDRQTPPQYEIVYGHRRHQACLELGLPVLCVVSELKDPELFAEMDRENRARKNLSAYEQGLIYKRALEQGLFPSLRRMADALGVNLSDVSRAKSIADLPKEVLEAFPSKLDLQYRWAKPLSDAFAHDPHRVLQRAAAIRQKGKGVNAKQVFDALMGDIQTAAQPITVMVRGSRMATLRARPGGQTVLEFAAGAVPPHRQRALAELVSDFLQRE